MKTTNLRFVISIAALGLASTWLSSCNDSRSVAGTSDDPNQITASIEGVVEKGPFVKGTTVTLYELNSQTFAQTGKTFTGTVDGDDGSFSIGKVELDSRYVLVEASGYYWNELYGLKSTNPLSLKAVAKVGKDGKININVGTHITHKRILSLVENGMDFDKAKSQAEKEVVEAFFGDKAGTAFENASIFDDEKLLALSVLVLLAGPEPDVTEMIASLAAGVNDDLLVKLADKAALRYNEYAYARRFMDQHFPDASIGYFEHYIIAFWQKVYGLGECNKDKSGVLDTVRAEKSENAGKVLICKEFEPESGVYLWLSASNVEQNTFNLEPVEDGRLIRSETDSTVAYVYDNGKWREAYSSEITVGIGCVKTTNDSLVVMGRKAYRCEWKYCIETVNGFRSDGTFVMPDSTDFVCRWNNSPAWKSLGVKEFPKDYFFSKNVEYGTVTDERDGKVYRTVELAGKTWMAENLSYGVLCSIDSSYGCFYKWRPAMDIPENDSIVIGDVHQGICMKGWHVPDSTEWVTLLSEYELAGLKSEIGWLDGTNETGFSVIPTSYDCQEFRDAYSNTPVETHACSDFIVARSREGVLPLSNNEKTYYGVMAAFDVDGTSIKTMAQISKSSSRGTKAVLRCVKDYNLLEQSTNIGE
ncbi:major paralogous domain-containing protein [Fibrobacter sp. UWCM]|uniref:FISUMP domain-containing protein n=1 Tax=Fibrobacter sp. UWCM TaxID=1896208 RepID=UPI0009112EED|nr:FISUMP domain-containing protein [Fibrobacter sp. UWCM]SHG61768.1 major paralogous domain-containing protein [Fibrobacter sp. UWCM]